MYVGDVTICANSLIPKSLIVIINGDPLPTSPVDVLLEWPLFVLLACKYQYVGMPGPRYQIKPRRIEAESQKLCPLKARYSVGLPPMPFSWGEGQDIFYEDK